MGERIDRFHKFRIYHLLQCAEKGVTKSITIPHVREAHAVLKELDL